MSNADDFYHQMTIYFNNIFEYLVIGICGQSVRRRSTTIWRPRDWLYEK